MISAVRGDKRAWCSFLEACGTAMIFRDHEKLAREIRATSTSNWGISAFVCAALGSSYQRPDSI